MGVPQGSILGPVLFIIYINDMVHSSELFKCINFADDTTLITHLNNEDMRNESLNYELANLHNYLKANKLSLNVNKTKAMVFHMPQKRIQLPLIKIAGEDIAFVDNFNFHGIIINKHLNWTSHADMLTAKLSKTIGILNTLKHVLPINIMRTLYTSLILCHLNYGVLLWGPKLRVNDNLIHKQLPHYFEQFTFTFRYQQHNYATRTCYVIHDYCVVCTIIWVGGVNVCNVGSPLFVCACFVGVLHAGCLNDNW